MTVAQSSQAEYYAAHLAFSNGQKFVVPLYVPYQKDKIENESHALKLAQEIGAAAARTGEINLVEWMLADRVPFCAFLRAQLLTSKNDACFEHSPQFTTQLQTFKKRVKDNIEHSSPLSALFHIHLFDGDSLNSTQRLVISVPSDFQSPELTAFLDHEVEMIFGTKSRRHQLKSSARTAKGLPTDTMILQEPSATIRMPSKFHGAGAQFVLPGIGTFTCTLCTSDREVASARLAQILDYIRISITEGSELTIADVQAYREKLTGKEFIARRRSLHHGPVIIYAPKNVENEPAKEALRLYTGLFGTQATGHVVQLHVVPPSGGSKDKMYTTTCSIAAERGLTSDEADTLRMALRRFFDRKLTAFYQAGGDFRDEKDLVYGEKGFAFTPQGQKKLHSILEGRLKADFINEALKAGYHNPFDESLSPNAVYLFGGMRPSPQPANSQIRLLNTREVAPQEGQSAIRSTLVFSGLDDRELCRYGLQFASMDQLVELVHSIDDWTTRVRTTPVVELSARMGVALLRKHAQPFLDTRNQNIR